jgi:hypothetical protein
MFAYTRLKASEKHAARDGEMRLPAAPLAQPRNILEKEFREQRQSAFPGRRSRPALAATPEPGTMTVLGFGLGVLFFIVRQ